MERRISDDVAHNLRFKLKKHFGTTCHPLFGPIHVFSKMVFSPIGENSLFNVVKLVEK